MRRDGGTGAGEGRPWRGRARPSANAALAPALESARRLTGRAVRQLGLRLGSRMPYLYVAEYPRSGGTWLAQMVAAYCGMPLPQAPLLPPVRRSVIHNHWPYDPRYRLAIHMRRDGRDAMTSLYFHRMRMMATPVRSPFARQMHRRYEHAFGRGFDWRDSASHMARFIELEIAHPRECREAWSAFTLGWAQAPRHQVLQVSYEELSADPMGVMRPLLEGLLQAPVEQERLADVIAAYEFEALTGRHPGEDDPLAFHRKGIVGDWRNHFDPAAAAVFDEVAGAALVELGYEADRAWVSRVSR